jgi:hypothetical protein
MKALSFNSNHQNEATGFDLVRLSRSKETVDLCSNTIRHYSKFGLQLFKAGKAIFFCAISGSMLGI